MEDGFDIEGVLFANPGSPTLPARRQDGELGTLGILEIKRGAVIVEIVHLRED